MCKQCTIAIELINLSVKIHWYRAEYVNSISCMYLSFLPAKPVGTILTALETGTPPFLQIPILHHVMRREFQFLNACLIRYVLYRISCVLER